MVLVISWTVAACSFVLVACCFADEEICEAAELTFSVTDRI